MGDGEATLNSDTLWLSSFIGVCESCSTKSEQANSSLQPNENLRRTGVGR